ncbi:MAG TPA: hypothetical protein VF730_14790 [Terracidiphilus sp.]
MCLARQNMPCKARILFSVGNLSLCAGLILSRFTNGLNQQQDNWRHFLSGFLLGLAIVLLLATTRLTRRHPQNQ